MFFFDSFTLFQIKNDRMKDRFNFRLNNNLLMPQIGLGVLFAKNNGEVENAVTAALNVG